MKIKKRAIWAIVMPVASGLIFAGLSFLPEWRSVERAVYDAYLFLRPAAKEDKSILLLDVDDKAINEVGMWPWPRSIIADGLVSLREFEARYAVFDIEYVDRSAMGLDSDYLAKGLKTEFDLSFLDVKSGFTDIMNGLANRTLDLAGALQYSRDVLDYADYVNADLFGKVSGIAIDNDAQLGKAMRMMGSAYVTVNLQKETVPRLSEEGAELARSRFSLQGIEGGAKAKRWRDAWYTIPAVSAMAHGAGFTNVEVDKDGKRRRIALTAGIGDDIYPQLIMAPLLDRLGQPRLTIGRRKLSLDGLSEGPSKLSIPLDEDGFMLINWPKEKFGDMFGDRHISFLELYQLRQAEKQLATELAKLAANEAWQYIKEGNAAALALHEAWKGSEALRRQALDSGSDEDTLAFLAAKQEALTALGEFVDSDYGEQALAVLDADQKRAANQERGAAIRSVREELAQTISNLKITLGSISAARNRLAPKFKDAMCVIGWTSTATTDMGANPFHNEMVNVGTHAAVANTILQRSFLRESPRWLSALLALVLPFILIFSTKHLAPTTQNALGVGTAFFLFPASFILFFFSGYFLAPMAVGIAVLLSSISHSLLTFIITEREKSFLRKAFGTYLSGAVIDQIVADPGQLKLGGSKRWMTAMFTDVRGFSTISEKLDPESLVKLLNRYLTAMSDIILERHGTIDKYEGDAIIAFFGAPLDLPSHASACVGAAIMMKRREALLNAEVMAEGQSPTPLLTRIGINTGDMVVGNMGTEKKMDYTIMGNAVNLAARLEGVNKQYGSWILATDSSLSETGDEFLSRRLDRVRVVGINTPVQLREVVDFRAEADQKIISLIDRFHEALDIFEKREWDGAREAFRALNADYPEDGPTKKYLERCNDAEYIRKLSLPAWDGVFNLSEK